MLIGPIDLVDPDSYREQVPFEWFDYLRRESPLFWHEEPLPNHGFWAVTRHEDLIHVHLHPEIFSTQVGAVALDEPDDEELRIRRTMLETDPPRHHALRTICNKRFSRGAIRRDEPVLRQVVRQVLDPALAKAEFDFVSEISREIPIRILCVLLGIPQAHAPQLAEWADELILDKVGTDPSGPKDRTTDLVVRSPTALRLFKYARGEKADRLVRPRGDVLTALASAEESGTIDERASHNYLSLLMIAGNETSRHAISHGMMALVDHPDHMRRLRRNPSLWPDAVEEILRWSTPIMHFRRTATCDTELGGERIRKGDKVVTWYISANRDEIVFEAPYRFDIRRRPNPHVAFGPGGPHFCLGAHSRAWRPASCSRSSCFE